MCSKGMGRHQAGPSESRMDIQSLLPGYWGTCELSLLTGRVVVSPLVQMVELTT
jgi:hypothetical protein